MLAVVQALEKGGEWVPDHIKLFGNWFSSYYCDNLHHHHDAEEGIYNPRIRAKGGNFTESLAADHKTIFSDLAKMKEHFRMVSTDMNLLPELCQFIRDYIARVEEHLSDEEVQYPQALRSSGMTQEEEKAIVQDILKGLGLAGTKKILPPILYVMCMWKGEHAMQEFYKQEVPAPLRVLCKGFWLADFYHNNLTLLRGLQGEERYVPHQRSCGCSIQ